MLQRKSESQSKNLNMDSKLGKNIYTFLNPKCFHVYFFYLKLIKAQAYEVT